LKNPSKIVANVGAIIIMVIILQVVLKRVNRAYPDKLKPRKIYGHDTEFDKAISFDLNDLLKHELQQASVSEEGEAAVSLDG